MLRPTSPLVLGLLLLVAAASAAGRLTPLAFLSSGSGSGSCSTPRHLQQRGSSTGFPLPSLPCWCAPSNPRRTPATLTPPALARVRGGACSGNSLIHRASTALAALPAELAAIATGPVGVGFGTNTALALLGVAVKQRWLTPAGLLHAWVLGVALWSTLGWRGWLVCVLYLVFGSLVTKARVRSITSIQYPKPLLLHVLIYTRTHATIHPHR